MPILLGVAVQLCDGLLSVRSDRHRDQVHVRCNYIGPENFPACLTRDDVLLILYPAGTEIIDVILNPTQIIRLDEGMQKRVEALLFPETYGQMEDSAQIPESALWQAD